MTAERRQTQRRSADKVPCPKCQHGISTVLDSRGPARVRECASCRSRFLTTETVVQLLAHTSSTVPTASRNTNI